MSGANCFIKNKFWFLIIESFQSAVNKGGLYKHK